jgi:microcin C transport system ATP-binding protein
LDDEIRWRLLNELLRMHRETGVAMLLVTHDAMEVRELAHWVVRMGKGRVVDQGPVPQIFGADGA